MNKIKLITASLLILGCFGCTTISYESPEGHKVKLVRYFTDVHIIVDLERKKAAYSTEVNSEAIKAVAEGITKGLIKGIK